MGATCQEKCPEICYCLPTNSTINHTNIDEILNKLGYFIEDKEFNEKIPEQVQKCITKRELSIPKNLNIND